MRQRYSDGGSSQDSLWPNAKLSCPDTALHSWVSVMEREGGREKVTRCG